MTLKMFPFFTVCLISLLVSNFLPPHVKKEDLVENYLMTLIKYFDEKGESFVAGCFLPEGAFNVLSAKYFIENLRFFRKCSIFIREIWAL